MGIGRAREIGQKVGMGRGQDARRAGATNNARWVAAMRAFGN